MEKEEEEERDRKKERKGKRKGNLGRRRMSKLVHFPFPWRELLKYLVQYPLICTTSSWEIWFDWFQPEPTVLGAAGTLPTGRYIRYSPIHDKASPASRWLTYLIRSLLEMEIA